MHGYYFNDLDDLWTGVLHCLHRFTHGHLKATVYLVMKSSW